MGKQGKEKQVIVDTINGNELKKNIAISRQIWVPYSQDICFTKITSQLEAPADWDPFILHVWPLSATRNQRGATSRILINLAGHIHNCRAQINLYQPYNSFSWFLTDHPRVWVSWRLAPQSTGTEVSITIAHEYSIPLFEKLWWKVRYQGRLATDLEKTLIQFRRELDNSHDWLI